MASSQSQNLGAGVQPDSALIALGDAGAIVAADGLEADQAQPASLDLRLGAVAYRLRASFLPGASNVSDRLNDALVLHKLDLQQGAVLEKGCVYLVPLQERLDLPSDIVGAANPKSSTGRIDVFVRMIADKASRFDHAPAGYSGPIYAEISPRTFSILARTGDRLLQLRLRKGEQAPLREIDFSLDLSPEGSSLCGYRAKRHSGVLDLTKIGGHAAQDYWEPVHARHGRIILDPDEFYILASKEKVVIPVDQAAEMAPIAPELGEFRAHYAGFFDPGFGLNEGGGKAVLEVRSRDVPFILEDGQPVGRLVYEAMAAPPDTPYGAAGATSNYQGQGLKLSKHFAANPIK